MGVPVSFVTGKSPEERGKDIKRGLCQERAEPLA